MSTKLSSSPDELRSKFYALEKPQDVADLLEIDLRRLRYHIYIAPKSSRYSIFDIPKRAGSVRTISAPATALKIIQQKLNQVLLQVYSPKPCVHSFLPNRSIVSNAKVHLGKRNVFNIDLENFFPSINFGRVRGLFMGKPYNLCPTASTILAQICCFNNQLPQGAPTSPIVTNMICAQMDSQLMALARVNKCDYTRYADDITFSTNLRDFPTALVTLNSLGQVEVGAELEQIITQNGFKINTNKIRLRGKNLRQQVTGITVNKFPNVKRKLVRQIRAMLHAWEKFGLEAAQEEFHRQYDRKHRSEWKKNPSFKRVVKGKIEYLRMVRGKNDHIYLSLCSELKRLAPELIKIPTSITKVENGHLPTPIIFTEGKSDWKHMKCALSTLRDLGQYPLLQLDFNEYESDMGEKELEKLCRLYAKTKQERPTIFIFDRDIPQTVAKMSDDKLGYKDWGNNVFSLAIPLPSHRQDNPNTSIEFYYTDEEIQRADEKGRRLFLSNEFEERGGWHVSGELVCHELDKIQRSDVTIIDCKVCDRSGNDVALSKNAFAENVLNHKAGFDNFDFTQFGKFFEVVQRILETCACS
jgi:RNA-directed DNA polymerase